MKISLLLYSRSKTERFETAVHEWASAGCWVSETGKEVKDGVPKDLEYDILLVYNAFQRAPSRRVTDSLEHLATTRCAEVVVNIRADYYG